MSSIVSSTGISEFTMIFIYTNIFSYLCQPIYFKYNLTILNFIVLNILLPHCIVCKFSASVYILVFIHSMCLLIHICSCHKRMCHHNQLLYIFLLNKHFNHLIYFLTLSTNLGCFPLDKEPDAQCPTQKYKINCIC